MKARRFLSTVLIFLCIASLLFGCNQSQPSSGDQENNGEVTLPDNEQPGDNTENNQPGDNNDNEYNNDNTENENNKIDLPDDYVITMSDMERFLLTKNEQYPITNEYVEQREAAEKSATGNKEADRNLINMINKEYRDEKAVKNAITRIHNGTYKIVRVEATDDEAAETTEAVETVEAVEEAAQAE